MKRGLALILMLMVLVSFAGCKRVMYDETDFIRRARKEFHVSDVDAIEMTFIGEVTSQDKAHLWIERDKALLWVMTGNENQTHHYLPMSCTMTKDGGRVFEHAYKTLERGTEIVVLPQWCGGYAFCVNNPACKTIRIDDVSGVKEIEVTEYPFLYYNKLLPREYFFLDAAGEEIN